MDCTNHLLFADDFTAYTTEADVTAAYAIPGDNTYDAAATEFGAAFGPDGQPGIRDQTIGAARDTGAISRYLSPQGRCFKVRGRWNFAATNHVLTTHPFLRLTLEGVDTMVQLNRIHSTGTLRVVVRTDAAGDTVGAPVIKSNQQDFTGALVTNVPVTVEVRGRHSTMTESPPGTFKPNHDGFVEVDVAGVTLYAFTGAVWARNNADATPRYTIVRVATIGAFSDWLVWDELPDDVEVVDGSEPCCSVVGDGTVPAGGGTGGGADPTEYPNIGTQIACVGLGLVPTQADLTFAENWWGH